MPYLTPDEIPESDTCRSLLIPASTDWLAIVSGALTELIKTYNWEQRGAVTVEEAVARMQGMINAYYAGCDACTNQPGGARIIRIGADGHLEEVGDDGTWQPATGDYAYPPVPAREGGTTPDQICLAAKNAENVLHQIYEQMADYFASELTPAEALTALMTWLLTTFEIGAGTIVFALAAFILPVLALVWGALSYLTVDLWDENYTKALICTLVECATDTDGVVTFDWDCIEHALYAAAVTFEISEVQLRLYAQVNYLIWILGGVDALNTMGATTAITNDDCSFCDDIWCYQWDDNAALLAEGAVQDYATDVSNFWHLNTSAFTLVRAEFPYCMGGGGGSAVAMWPTPDFSDVWALYSGLTAGCYDFDSQPLAVSPVAVTTGIAWGCNSGGDVEPPASSNGLKIHGSGAMPAFTSGHTC